MSVIKVLPELRANGAAQMALDQGLLEAADEVVARRYTWAPPALSLGRFQKWDHEVPKLPFDVVRRPSGGRAVLHGEDFEWSFAFAFPPGSLGDGTRAAADVAAPYDLVAGSFAAALEALGVQLDEARTEPYHRSTLCFATVAAVRPLGARREAGRRRAGAGRRAGARARVRARAAPAGGAHAGG